MPRHVRWNVCWLLALLLCGCGASAAQRTPATSAAARQSIAQPSSGEPTASTGGAAVSASSASMLPSGSAAGINVFAAASLSAAFEDLGAQWAATANAEVAFNFAGSQQLAQQINQGAPADVFAAANQRQMDVAIEAGRIITGTQQIFARNQLVMIYPQDNPAAITQLADLAKPGNKVVLADSAVPVGQYTLDFLAKASAQPTFGSAFRDTVLGNVVSYEDNVKAVLTKVALGEADAGIVYSSDVSPTATTAVRQLEIPPALDSVATYPIAPIDDSPNAELARQFIAFVLSPEGQAVLARHGFMTLDAAGPASVSER